VRNDDPSLEEQFRAYRREPDLGLRNHLVEQHTHLAEYHARRYATATISRDDLRQVALLGVIAAVERFDPEYGTSFSTFAGRTIDGECKRYLRDRGWAIRPPRQVQETHLHARRAQEELTHSLGRPPTTAELARFVGQSEEQLLEALEAGSSQVVDSIDAADAPDAAWGGELGLGASDPGFGLIDRRLEVEQLLEGLDERDRAVVRLRFYGNLSQPEIARRLAPTRPAAHRQRLGQRGSEVDPKV